MNVLKNRPLSLHLVGLGDVGVTLLTGLKLVGRELSDIGVYDPDENRCKRCEMEFNQVLALEDAQMLPQVRHIAYEDVFDCDIVVFCASRGVPPLGAQVDVRMAQLEANKQILRAYARTARQRQFRGLFCQVADPVDLLARYVYLESNRTEDGTFDGAGLAAEQIMGCGLGVMQARAMYMAKEMGIDPGKVRVFGPHGRGLVAANAVDGDYDETVSAILTQRVITANLAVRETGYKPYIAPALSSGAATILRAIRGDWHDAAVPVGDAVYFGCRSRLTSQGRALEKIPNLPPQLAARLQRCYTELSEVVL